ncbi:response regulator transcription factor [Solicola sp. PLA-1-18]|uniref:response regulator transcription factor n=1 Tax=Solicola sp. PLA-1-18 TaxID=3380532 RepID=UPI003B7A23C5
MRVLVVDDEQDLLHPLTFGLSEAGYAVDGATTGREALDKAEVVPYDVVVLDLGLPDMDGLEVCHRLRHDLGSDARVLVLTARAGVLDRVRGLDAGADDYLLKPFAFPELVARIRALLRREITQPDAVLTSGALRLDVARHEVWWHDQLLALTRKEFGVLEYLMSRVGVVVPAEELLKHVWDEHTDPFTQTVRVTVGTLRRKLAAGDRPAPLETVVGRGYRLKEPA